MGWRRSRHVDGFAIHGVGLGEHVFGLVRAEQVDLLPGRKNIQQEQRKQLCERFILCSEQQLAVGSDTPPPRRAIGIVWEIHQFGDCLYQRITVVGFVCHVP